MPVTWFLVPYEILDKGEKARPFRFVRRCGMMSLFPDQDNKEGVRWEEVETRGNNAIVSVNAPDSALITLRAQANFVEIPPQGVIPANRRGTILSKLQELGFTTARINATSFAGDALIALLGSERGVVGKNAAGTGLEVKPQVLPSARPVLEAGRKSTRPAKEDPRGQKNA